MKRLFSLLALMVAFCSFSFATVRTLSNMTPNPGQFSNFTAAHDASSPGDTIYVHGSTVDYGSVFIFKPLVVIGTGHNPIKQNPVVSSFLDIIIVSNNVHLIGLRMRHVGASGYINCSIKKCRITSDGISNYGLILSNAANWLIEGNIIESVGTVYESLTFGFTAAHNTVVQYNVFLSPYYKITGIWNNVSQRTYILNNLFLGHTPSQLTFNGLEYCNIDNNIFHTTIPDGNNPTLVENSTMNNNMSFLTGDNVFYQPGSNNISADPQFVLYTGPQTLFDYAWDVSLQAGSLGDNSGTDGTDRGVYGGLGNKFTETGEPSIAEITAFTITSPTTIPPGGTLTISVTSKRVP